jgi:hypothetical protein
MAGRASMTVDIKETGDMNERDRGRQPLDEIMIRLGLSNDDLVRASKEQLTHKMVQKGRKGRLLTLNVQTKILNALNAYRPGETYSLESLFNYRGHE